MGISLSGLAGSNDWNQALWLSRFEPPQQQPDRDADTTPPKPIAIAVVECRPVPPLGAVQYNARCPKHCVVKVSPTYDITACSTSYMTRAESSFGIHGRQQNNFQGGNFFRAGSKKKNNDCFLPNNYKFL